MRLKHISELILAAHNAKGGSTFTVDGTNCSGHYLYAVSVYKEREMVLDGSLTEQAVADYIRANWEKLEGKHWHMGAPTERAIGTWTDPKTGKTYVDIVALVPSKSDAARLAKWHDQLAFCYLLTGESIYV